MVEFAVPVRFVLVVVHVIRSSASAFSLLISANGNTVLLEVEMETMKLAEI